MSETFCHSRMPFCQASAARDTLPLLNAARSSSWLKSMGALGPSLTTHFGCFVADAAGIN